MGHSIVAGNDRPFRGTIEKLNNPDRYLFQVKEPGNNKYDGEFSFTFSEDENKLIGKWTAYKNIEIKNRKYMLNPKKFTYNPDIMLEDSKNPRLSEGLHYSVGLGFSPHVVYFHVNTNIVHGKYTYPSGNAYMLALCESL